VQDIPSQQAGAPWLKGTADETQRVNQKPLMVELEYVKKVLTRVVVVAVAGGGGPTGDEGPAGASTSSSP
jgi:hypothetical protein